MSLLEKMLYTDFMKKNPPKGSGIKRKSKSKSKPVIRGVNVRDIPPLMKFGKVYITADQLYYNNLLGIRNKNNRQVKTKKTCTKIQIF
jgi:hypothetical protein